MELRPGTVTHWIKLHPFSRESSYPICKHNVQAIFQEHNTTSDRIVLCVRACVCVNLPKLSESTQVLTICNILEQAYFEPSHYHSHPKTCCDPKAKENPQHSAAPLSSATAANVTQQSWFQACFLLFWPFPSMLRKKTEGWWRVFKK